MRGIFILSLGAVLLLLLSSFVEIEPIFLGKQELFSELDLVRRDLERGVKLEEITKEVEMQGFRLAEDGSCFNLSQGDSFILTCPPKRYNSCLFLQTDVEPRTTYVGENVSYRALGISSCGRKVGMEAFLLLPPSCPLPFRGSPGNPVAPDRSGGTISRSKCFNTNFTCLNCVLLGCWAGEYEVSAEMGIKPSCPGNYTVVTILSDGNEEARSDSSFLAMAVSVSARADPDKVRSGEKVRLMGHASASYDVITSYQAVLLTPSGRVFLDQGAGNYTEINKTYYYAPQREGSYKFMFIVYDRYGRRFQANASFSDSSGGGSSSSCPTFALSVSGDRYSGYTVTVTYSLEQIWNVQLCVDGRCWSSSSSPKVGCGALSAGRFDGDTCHYASASGSGRTTASASRSFGACGGPSSSSQSASQGSQTGNSGIVRTSDGYHGPRIPDRVLGRKMEMV